MESTRSRAATAMWSPMMSVFHSPFPSLRYSFPGTMASLLPVSVLYWNWLARAAMLAAHGSRSGLFIPNWLGGVSRWMYLKAPPLKLIIFLLMIFITFFPISLYGKM